MREWNHGCDIKIFCFSHANHASTNLKKFLSSKLYKVTLFTHSFVGWNLGNLYKQAVSIFFAKADILSEKNPYFGKHLFAKQELISVQEFVHKTGKNFCFNQCHNKEFLSIFLGKIIETRQIPPTPLVLISGYAKKENVFYCLNNLLAATFEYSTWWSD